MSGQSGTFNHQQICNLFILRSHKRKLQQMFLWKCNMRDTNVACLPYNPRILYSFPLDNVMDYNTLYFIVYLNF